MPVLTLPLFDILSLPSVDAPHYTVCSQCGGQWNWYDTQRCAHRTAWRSGEVVADCLLAKQRDDQFESLSLSLDKFGITTPILVEGRRVGNGHHRLAWAFDRDIDRIPVVYSLSDYWRAEDDSNSRTGWRY